MSHLIGIVALSTLCYLFWQQRCQSEIAKQAIARKCAALDLQLISTSFGQHKWKTPHGRWRWHTIYHFEFSAVGDDCYQGQLIMLGFNPVDFTIPPHKVP